MAAMIGCGAARRLPIDTDGLTTKLYRLINCFSFYDLFYGYRTGIHFTFSDNHVLLVKRNGHRTA